MITRSVETFVAFALGALVAAGTAGAEVGKLGGYTLGQTVKKPGTTRLTAFRCIGRVRPEIDRKKKVVRVRFDADGCPDVELVVAAITKDMGAEPVTNAAGDQLWEGKAASVILAPSLGVTPATPAILLVPPGAGTKRTCWADDGFAAFWSDFRKATASRKVTAVTSAFTFPLKDDEGEVKYKDAKALTAAWTELIEDADAKAIGSGKLAPRCQLDQDSYTLSLPGSYSELTATRVGGAWRWTSMSSVASG
jgi:hypothetical protein